MISGKVCVVTGASGGIGEASARALSRRGATVILAARRRDRLEAIAREIRSAGGAAASARTCDVADAGQVEDLRDRVEADHGRCDVLINNAGIPGGGAFADATLEQIERVNRVNFLGVLICTKVFLPMLRASKGHVVNIASLAGRYALPGAAVYAATKHAVVALSESLLCTRSLGVRFTVLCPGFVRTEGFPHPNPPPFLTLTVEQVADKVVEIVRTGRQGTITMPAWAGPLSLVQRLAPPLYRAAVHLGEQIYGGRVHGGP